MGELISLGSINADFQVRSDAPLSGSGTVIARDFLRTAGGKAANVAVLGARCGASVRLIGCVGQDDLAHQALSGPQNAGVDLSRIRRRPGPTGYSVIVVGPSGDKTIVLTPNANDAWGDDPNVASDVVQAPDGSVLVTDLEVPTSVVRAGVAAAHRRGFPVVLDPSWPDRLDDSLLRGVDHLTPDHHETEALTGIKPDHPTAAREAAHQLHRRGAGAVYVKLPTGGCVVADRNDVRLFNAPSDIEVVDTTGAGDAFAAGLALGLLLGHGRDTPARWAVAASTAAVTAYGSQESYPDEAQLRAGIERVTVSVLHY